MNVNIDENSGYKLHLQNDLDNIFYFNKSINKSFLEISENINNVKTTLNNFGIYPYVYKAGEMNYKTFDLNGLFLRDDNHSAKQNLDIFKEKVNQNKPFVMINPLGDEMLVDITIKSISNPLLYQEYGVEYILVNISCIEIGVV